MARHSAKREKKGKDARRPPGRPSGAPPARRPAAVAFIVIVALYVALRLPGIGVPLDRDEGVFGYMGQLILDGGLPYRDAVDHKPPVSFYINALALCFVPPTARGIHVFLLVYNFLTLVCIFFPGKGTLERDDALWSDRNEDLQWKSPAPWMPVIPTRESAEGSGTGG
jgi:hypothetical protein